jgi:hypothetical protein
MPSPQKILSSAGFWIRMGSTDTDAISRLTLMYPSAGRPALETAMAQARQMQVAGIALQNLPGNMPLAGFAMPVNPGQSSQYQYKATVPIFDADTDQTSSILVVIDSPKPMSYSEIETQALGEAGQTLERSPEKFITPGGGEFRVDLLTPKSVSVVSASTRSVPSGHWEFGLFGPVWVP